MRKNRIVLNHTQNIGANIANGTRKRGVPLPRRRRRIHMRNKRRCVHVEKKSRRNVQLEKRRRCAPCPKKREDVFLCPKGEDVSSGPKGDDVCPLQDRRRCVPFPKRDGVLVQTLLQRLQLLAQPMRGPINLRALRTAVDTDTRFLPERGPWCCHRIATVHDGACSALLVSALGSLTRVHKHKWPGQVRWDLEDPCHALQGHTDKTAIAEFFKQTFIRTRIGTGRGAVQLVKA